MKKSRYFVAVIVVSVLPPSGHTLTVAASNICTKSSLIRPSVSKANATAKHRLCVWRGAAPYIVGGVST